MVKKLLSRIVEKMQLGEEEGPVDINSYIKNLKLHEDDALGYPESDILYIKSMDLDSDAAIDAIASEIEDGNIVMVNLKPLQKHPPKLKVAVNKLKTFCDRFGGDIAGLNQNMVIVAPAGVRVARGQK